MWCHIIILPPSTQKWSTKYYDCTAALRLSYAQCIDELKTSSSQKQFSIKHYYYVISILTLCIFYLITQQTYSFFPPYNAASSMCVRNSDIFFVISPYMQFFKRMYLTSNVFGFSLHLVPQTIFIPQRILRDITRNVLRSSCKVPEISFRPVPKRKFYENLFNGSHDVPHGLTYEEKGGWASRLIWLGQQSFFATFPTCPKLWHENTAEMYYLWI